MPSLTPVLDTRDKPKGEHLDRKAPSARPGLGTQVAPSAPRFEPVPLLQQLRHSRTAGPAVVLFTLMALCAVVAPLLHPAGDAIDFSQELLAPSPTHPFGTDQLGRDVFIRVMKGARISLTIGLLAMSVALGVGTLVGSIAGYKGGVVDAVTMRLTDLALALPLFLLVLFFSSVLPPGVITLCVLVGATQWMEVARVVRTVVVSTKQNDFVEAARALGATDLRILFHHVLKHAGGPLLVAGTVIFAQAIMLESAVSYLGFGIQPPSASWGGMLQDAQSSLGIAPWLAFFPGVMIASAVLCCYALGEFLRTAAPRP